MKNHYALYTLLCIFIYPFTLIAQVPFNAALPNGYTKTAMVAEQIGLTDVTITYHRPSVKGREGKIWGELVHKGFIDQGFGKGNPAPWRAGANENTVIEFSKDVKVEGQLLSKGRYGFFIAYDPIETVVIFSKRTDGWGSFFYDEKEDALRVNVKPQPLDKSTENLKYEFIGQTPNSAVIMLTWEKLSIPFKVEVDLLKQQFEALISEAQHPGGFTSQSLNIAAGWCLQNNYELQKGLEWATSATGKSFPGDPSSFPALVTKASLLDKLGKADEAATALNNALPFGTVLQLQQLGRQLIAAKKPTAALTVFRFNYDKNPGLFITLVGMARGLSANGEYDKSLESAIKALPLAPDDANKHAITEMIEKLKAGKDIN